MEDIGDFVAEMVAKFEQEKREFDCYISKVFSVLDNIKTEQEIYDLNTQSAHLNMSLEQFVRFLTYDNEYYQNMPICVLIEEIERMLNEIDNSHINK